MNIIIILRQLKPPNQGGQQGLEPVGVSFSNLVKPTASIFLSVVPKIFCTLPSFTIRESQTMPNIVDAVHHRDQSSPPFLMANTKKKTRRDLTYLVVLLEVNRWKRTMNTYFMYVCRASGGMCSMMDWIR